MKYKIISMLSIMLLLNCNNPESFVEVSEQFKQWKSKNIHNYTVDQKRSCFCLYSGEVVRITVQSDKIVSIIRISDSSKVTYPYYFAIDSLFGIIKAHKYDSIVVKYNKEFGYPESMDVDPQDHPADGGVLYETSNLKVL